MSTGATLMPRQQRDAAAAKYRPARVSLLLVAEAPPCTADRYFYFEDVRTQDSLFRYVCAGLFGVTPPRERKAEFLAKLRDAGVFLIDVSQEPIADDAKVRIAPTQIEGLVARCEALRPDAVVLIKSNVYDLTYRRLKEAGLNVVDVRMPFPGSGQQTRFATAFAEAIAKAGLERP